MAKIRTFGCHIDIETIYCVTSTLTSTLNDPKFQVIMCCLSLLQSRINPEQYTFGGIRIIKHVTHQSGEGGLAAVNEVISTPKDSRQYDISSRHAY